VTGGIERAEICLDFIDDSGKIPAAEFPDEDLPEKVAGDCEGGTGVKGAGEELAGECHRRIVRPGRTPGRQFR
jgi:hypothetical protein